MEGEFRREALKEIPDKFFLIFDTYLGKKNKSKFIFLKNVLKKRYTTSNDYLNLIVYTFIS